MFRRLPPRLVPLAVLVALAGCAGGRATAPSADVGGSTLLPPVAGFSFAITTSSPEAQRWFDQGLLFLYGFDHGEAIRSFRAAAALDPDAAMPWWGIATANGMHINLPEMSEAQWRDGDAAIRAAVARLDDETALERALIDAAARRFTWPAPEAQRPYDEAYAAAMRDVHRRFPGNPDVAVLFAESLMNLQPWDYWTPERTPKGFTTEFVAALEDALAIDPDHPQACHLYIHAMEAGPDPARAEASADTLAARALPMGHLVHMPSHLYARVGRYPDAVDANVLAVAADHRLFAQGNDPGLYWVYHAHNLHFLAFAAMMEGRADTALAAARELETVLPDEVLDAYAFLIEGIVPTTRHVMIRFGRWEDILREPAPPARRPLMLAVHHYSRGIALSALGRTDEARREIALYRAQAERVPDDWWVFSNTVDAILPIADAMLDGELAYREGRLDDAWAALRRGIAGEDALVYDEPPGWMIPVRHAMGALLLESGDAAEAERLYREDQARHPGNGWSLLGLQQALRAQGRDAEADAIGPRLDAAWARVTDRPPSSCLCAPGNG